MKKNIPLIAIALAMFMEAVDTTIINTAIPAMSHSLHTQPVSLKLALISYLLSLAIFIPISGWTADKYGIKRVFIWALIVFTLSSLWCGFTTNLIQLIIARSAQGIGGAFMMPVGRLLVLRMYERSELISKMSTVVMIASIGMMLGPVIGGIITEGSSWRWIFWVNIPFGLLGIYASIRFIPSYAPRIVPRFDKLGFILFGSGLAILVFGLSVFSEPSIDHKQSTLLIGLSILLILLYTKHSRKLLHPVVNVRIFSIRTFRIAVLGNIFSRLGFGGVPFLLPLLLQIGLGFSPDKAGMLLAPMAVGVLIIKPISTYILHFLGYKKVLILNTVLLSLCLCLLTKISISVSIPYIAFITFLYGLLISLQYTAMNSLAYANIETDDTGAATSIMGTIQQLAQSLGVAIAAILLNVFTPEHLQTLTLNALLFHKTFIAMAIMTFAATFIFLTLKPEDGQELMN